MSVLENFVKLEPGIRKVLHFYDHVIVTREIMDPVLGKPKPVRSLTFSIIQEKLAAALSPYLPGKRYLDFNFAITKIGAGFTAEFEVEAIPRPRS
jgi:hypothetical protein